MSKSKYLNKAFVATWLVLLLTFLGGAIVAFGYNSITHQFSLSDGFKGLSGMMSGIPAFIWLVIILLGGVILYSMKDTSNESWLRPLFYVGIGVLLTLFYMSKPWSDPNAASLWWAAFGFVVLTLLAAYIRSLYTKQKTRAVVTPVTVAIVDEESTDTSA